MLTSHMRILLLSILAYAFFGSLTGTGVGASPAEVAKRVREEEA